MSAWCQLRAAPAQGLVPIRFLLAAPACSGVRRWVSPPVKEQSPLEQMLKSTKMNWRWIEVKLKLSMQIPFPGLGRGPHLSVYPPFTDICCAGLTAPSSAAPIFYACMYASELWTPPLLTTDGCWIWSHRCSYSEWLDLGLAHLLCAQWMMGVFAQAPKSPLDFATHRVCWR